MKKYEATIKEKGNPSLLHPTYWGDDYVNEDFLIKFWGLEDEDVEWYEIREIKEN